MFSKDAQRSGAAADTAVDGIVSIGAGQGNGHFAYAASHDLQQHLRMVLAFNTLLMEEYGSQLDEKGHQYLSLSLDAARQMRELINDLLDYGRLGTEIERTRVFDAVAETDLVLESMGEIVRNTHAQIEIGWLPELYGNPVRFRRLMQNLLTNAVKFVSRRVVPRVHVSAENDGDFWRFRVQDNGLGIDPKYARTIFEPFKRLHAESEYGGTGLGLAICEKIIAGFGGTIWVESKPGRGSSFYFTIGKRDARDE